ncbi:DUF3263 domain-containing protein [Microbacterium amylolyticum]|uniref:DUF3263 domain-containing protein n=1 Tax=Microbacterium amylolyticum TaxID=936337 RepID=A0ABS4ZIV7_9MICO|nr:DUF3263 domain-containing protein [Microbacterium amylolyticum]MBP2437218.1 hypothetical protein [Microbacterium amylolyticum]
MTDVQHDDAAVASLDERARAVLAFESEWPRPSGAKEEAIRAHLDLEPARYYQLLARLVDDPAAWEHAPMLVARLRRLREQRAAHRARLLR